MVDFSKNTFRKFLLSFLIFVLAFAWVFSGWPQIWQRPPIPPEIKEVKANPESLILLWDGAGTPAGWTCISCQATDDFYEAFPRGAESYGSATSGSATHSHNATFTSCSNSAGSGYDDSPAEIDYPAAVHNHASADLAPVAASNDPPYRDLKLIQYSGIPSTVPTGTIAIFATTSLPANWAAYSAQDTYFLRGYDTAGGTGGANTHTHDVTITNMSPPSATITGEDFGGKSVETATHDHDGTGTSDSADHRPPYLEVVFAQASTTVSLSAGMIGMFDATPGSGWDVVSDSGDDFYQRFIVGNSAAYGATGGNATHTHATVTTPASSDLYADGDDAPAKDGSTIGHTHVITATFSEASNLPVYRDVIFAEYTAAAEPEVSCSASATSTDFGNLTADAVSTSTPNINVSMSCTSTASGCTLSVQGTGNTTTAGLWNNSASYLVTSTDATLSIGNEGYGIQATSSDGGWTLNSKYVVTGNQVGGLTITATTLASSSTDITTSTATVTHKAARSATTPEGSYQDTITYSCTVN